MLLLGIILTATSFPTVPETRHDKKPRTFRNRIYRISFAQRFLPVLAAILWRSSPQGFSVIDAPSLYSLPEHLLLFPENSDCSDSTWAGDLEVQFFRRREAHKVHRDAGREADRSLCDACTPAIRGGGGICGWGVYTDRTQRTAYLAARSRRL